jgi:hypothetical protein
LYYGTLAYPVIYVPCLIFARVMRAKDRDSAAFVFSVSPLAYLIVIGIPIAIAFMAGGGKH